MKMISAVRLAGSSLAFLGVVDCSSTSADVVAVLTEEDVTISAKFDLF